jgi:hypothetical protein
VAFGQGGWIRTNDIYVPNVALYQTELHPVFILRLTHIDLQSLPFAAETVQSSACDRSLQVH